MQNGFWGKNGDPEQNEETFVFDDYELCSDMRICPDCGELTGFLRYVRTGPFKEQPCNCRKKGPWPQAREDFRRYFNLDFSSAVTLRACCGQILIPNGSRFSPFFCKGCQKFVVAFNSYRRHIDIPLGRHSAMSGVSLGPHEIRKPKLISLFTRSSSFLVDRIRIISDWRKEIIADNLRRSGRADWNMDLIDYLDEMPQDWLSCYLAFLGFRKFFLEKRQKGLEIPIPYEMCDKEDENELAKSGNALYVQGEEIGCVFYTLVARNRSIELHWPGGLRGYLQKFGQVFNDRIVATCLMGLEFEQQLIELAENGLEYRSDFVLFDASDSILIKDGVPFDMPVEWLGGYHQDAKVYVFLKQ